MSDASHADDKRAVAAPESSAPEAVRGSAPVDVIPEASTAGDEDEHTRAVAAMFSRMTPWYDLQNHAFSLGFDFWWRRNLVRAVAPGPTGVVLDLAAGTLDVTLALIRRYPGMRVIAADICAPMLDYGMERKVKPGEKERITPLVADARRLPLPDASVDAVTIAFGIRNVRPRAEALAEMYRVLAPGGRVCVLEFAPVTTPVFGPAYHWYLKSVMPKLARLVSNSTKAYDYFADSIVHFPPPPAFSAELREAGFPFVQYFPFTLGVVNLHIAVRGA